MDCLWSDPCKRMNRYEHQLIDQSMNESDNNYSFRFSVRKKYSGISEPSENVIPEIGTTFTAKMFHWNRTISLSVSKRINNVCVCCVPLLFILTLWRVFFFRIFYSYLIENDVCYLVMCDKMYSKRSAFSYLEDLAQEFHKNYGRKVNTVTRPYAFIEFDVYIQKSKKHLTDRRRNINSINTQLQDVQRIMVWSAFSN